MRSILIALILLCVPCAAPSEAQAACDGGHCRLVVRSRERVHDAAGRVRSFTRHVVRRG